MMKEIKQGSLFFWGCWFFICWLTNVTEVLKTWHFLPDTWRFASGNWMLIRDIFMRQHISVEIAGFLFAVIIFLEFFIVVSFFYATVIFWKEKSNMARVVNRAFSFGLAFWAIFLISDECLIAYREEAKHIILACLMLLNTYFFVMRE